MLGLASTLLGAIIGVSIQATWQHYFLDFTQQVRTDGYRTHLTPRMQLI